MSKFIVIDKNDTASMNIYHKLMDEEKVFTKSSIRFKDESTYFYKDTYLVMNDKRSAEAEQIDEDIRRLTSMDPDMIIFPTVHRSKSGIPSLTTHVPGNWGTADAGGMEKKLCRSAESFMKEALMHMSEKIKTRQLTDFDVVQEVTHHGPLVSCPCMFIEIGSTEKEWSNDEAGRVIANTLVYLIENSSAIMDKGYKSFFGIGGPHTCSNFMKIVLNDERLALGHACPKYNLENLDEAMILQAIEKSSRPTDLVVLDWKGMGQEKDRIRQILEKNGIEYRKVKQFSYK
ncbi:MAG: D-aminoacyl-tRNA deacylase [Candidatus Woesearchaeota archaeon]